MASTLIPSAAVAADADANCRPDDDAQTQFGPYERADEVADADAERHTKCNSIGGTLTASEFTADVRALVGAITTTIHLTAADAAADECADTSANATALAGAQLRSF